MAPRPKLEFFKFSLNPKNSDEFKTFRDFAIDELKLNPKKNTPECFTLNFNNFMKKINTSIAKDDAIGKSLKVESKQSINLFYHKRPSPKASDFVIKGVINGGPYGKQKIIADTSNNEESNSLGKNKVILSYFYIYIYLPSDHNEGLFMIQSIGKEESITNIFRKYIQQLFSGNSYNKAKIESFCPKNFQDEFKEGALLKSLSFKTTIHTRDYFSLESDDDGLDMLFDIKIEAVPKDKVVISEAKGIKNIISGFLFGKESKKKQIKDFERSNFSAENIESKTTKIFEWDTLDHDFIPVVYLNDKVSVNEEDGSPDFDELEVYCDKIFKDHILQEIRPNSDVTKIS